MEKKETTQLVKNKSSNIFVPSTRCKSCNTELVGPFCSTCGQKTVSERLSLKHFSTEVFAVFTNIERGFWHTLLMLFKAPGKVINDYLRGATKRYYNPFRLVFILATLSAVLMAFSNISDEFKKNHDKNHTSNQELYEMGFELGSGGKKPPSVDTEKGKRAEKDRLEFEQKFNNAMKKYMNLFIVFSVPFMAFFSWLLFRQLPYNYAEHLAATCFMQSAILVFNILLTPLYYFGLKLFLIASGVYFIFMYLYPIYAYKDWLSISWGQSSLKSICINTLGITAYIISMFVVGIIVVLAILALK